MMLNFLKQLKKGRREQNEGPLINVLTRTSNRPNGFRLCHESVLKQRYENIIHLVSYDQPEDLDYLKNYKIQAFRVYPESEDNLSEDYKPYNLYCNRLLEEVQNGWVMFLDDDDMLANPKVFKHLLKYINTADEDTLFIWQTQFPDGLKMPSDKVIKQETIKFQHIDTNCFLFHSKYANSVKWDSYLGADFRFIKAMSEIIPNKKWIKKVFTRKNNFGDQGRRNDIPSSEIM